MCYLRPFWINIINLDHSYTLTWQTVAIHSQTQDVDAPLCLEAQTPASQLDSQEPKMMARRPPYNSHHQLINQNQQHIRPAAPTEQQTQKQQDQAAVAGAASPRQSFDLEHFRIVNKYHGPWKSQYEVLIWIHDSRGDPLGLGQDTFSNNEAEEVPEIISWS